MRAAVMGAGSWGTTFAQVLCDAGTSAVLYARRPSQAKAIGELHQNPDYLPGVTLTPALEATSSAAAALDGADLVAFAVPAQSLRSNLLEWAPLIPPGALLVSLIKGIELGTRQRMSGAVGGGLGGDRARCRGGGRGDGEEPHRDRGRHRGRDGSGRQHQGHADHPRAGRDGPAGLGAQRAGADVRGAGGDGGPGGDVVLAAAPQPDA